MISLLKSNSPSSGKSRRLLGLGRRTQQLEPLALEEIVPLQELYADTVEVPPPLEELSWEKNPLSHLEPFNIQQLFLIYQDGRLISSVAKGDGEHIDKEMFSSMLTAIQEFIGDSIKSSGEGDFLESVNMGEFNLYTQAAERVFIVAVIDGSTPSNFAGELKSLATDLYDLHRDFLTHWDGDTTQLESIAGELREFLEYWSH